MFLADGFEPGQLVRIVDVDDCEAVASGNTDVGGRPLSPPRFNLLRVCCGTRLPRLDPGVLARVVTSRIAAAAKVCTSRVGAVGRENADVEGCII